MTLEAGTRLGPYEIVGPLGAGGMGEVYRAKDRKLDREVAVKVLPQTVANDPDSLARFEREAKAVAALSHPNILAIHDFGSQDGTAYAVMELLEGDTLRGRLDAGAVPQKQAADWALQIAKGLSAAHGKGVVHRDLKPENVFVTKDGHVKILDFGLAKRVDETTPGEQTSAPTGSGGTAPGTVMGTVGYMSPEQVRGLAVDHRSDIFSFGAILYELLSGKKAFKRDTASDTMAAIMRDEPPELSESGRAVPVALDHIVKHCLEKDGDSRFEPGAPLPVCARDRVLAFGSSGSDARDHDRRAGDHAEEGRREETHCDRRRRARRARRRSLVVETGEARLDGSGRRQARRRSSLREPRRARGRLFCSPGTDVSFARGSSTPYKKTTKTPMQIAQELGAPYLLTATVRW